MKSSDVILSVVVSAFFLYSCVKEPPVTPPDEPPPYKQSIFLSVADSGLTEVFLLLSIGDTVQPRGFEVFRDNAKVLSGSLYGKETTVVDESASLNTSYSYRAYRVDKANRTDSTPSVSMKTLDTTSHEWSWEIIEIGDGNSSNLFDVTIINDTFAIAVGDIHTAETDKFDSLHQWIDPYNVAVWNGSTWHFKRAYYNYNGQKSYGPNYSIFAFSHDDIWFEAGVHWNGTEYESFPRDIAFPSHANSMWGNAKGELYVVGNAGLLAKRSISGSWTLIKTDTQLDFKNIFGVGGGDTGKEQILAVCSNNFPPGRALYSIQRSTAVQKSTAPIPWDLSTIWFVPNVRYYLAGSGIFYKRSLSESSWRVDSSASTNYYITSIRGNGVNDIFAVGAFGEMMHYNGRTWRSYRNQTSFNGAFGSVSVRGNLVIAVGSGSRKGVIAIGRRGGRN